MAATAFAAPLAQARQAKDIQIAIIASKTGPLEAYAKQTIVEASTWAWTVRHGRHHGRAGRKLVVIEKDDQGKPDVGQGLLAAAYADDKVGHRGRSPPPARWPGHAAGGRGVQEDPAGGAAVADSITGDKWNKYIFRTGRNSSQDAAANAARWTSWQRAIATWPTTMPSAATAERRPGEFTKKAKIVHEEYLPVGTTDFTAGLQRIIDKPGDQPGNKSPVGRLVGHGQRRSPRLPTWTWKALRHQDRHRWQHPAAMVAYKLPGMEGALLLLRHPKNPVNEAWWPSTKRVSRSRRTSSPPAFSAAMAIVTRAQEDQRRHQHRQADCRPWKA